MPFDRLPESLQTVYAELLDQAQRGDADLALAVPTHGSFVSKVVKGRRYWYFQRHDAGRKRQRYLGPDSPALLERIDEIEARRDERAPDLRRRAELVDMLLAGGAAREPAAVARVLAVLAESRMFRLGGVVVGTQAFRCHANMLGVRFPGGALRTEDVDIANEAGLAVALAPEQAPVETLRLLQQAEPGFFAVPELDPRRPSTSFKVRGRDLRVDFLTPARGRNANEPVWLPLFRVAATPLPMLGYLIEDVTSAVVLGSGGVLVNVPVPARFALHKVWLAARRPVGEQAKARKDVRQAAALLEVLLEDRPGDIRDAWGALKLRPREARAVRAALERSGAAEPLRRTGELVGLF